MAVKNGIKVGETETTIKVVSNSWVKGETKTMYALDTDMDTERPHQDQHYDITVFIDDDGKTATINLESSIYTYLAGLWHDNISLHSRLMSHHKFTIDEIRMLAQALSTFVAGVDNGTIKPETE